jgi:hypothetical protein
MAWVGFEPTISVFEPAKTVHALDPAATVIGNNNDNNTEGLSIEIRRFTDWSTAHVQCESEGKYQWSHLRLVACKVHFQKYGYLEDILSEHCYRELQQTAKMWIEHILRKIPTKHWIQSEVYSHVIEWLQTGFGLVSGSIGQLNP